MHRHSLTHSHSHTQKIKWKMLYARRSYVTLSDIVHVWSSNAWTFLVPNFIAHLTEKIQRRRHCYANCISSWLLFGVCLSISSVFLSPPSVRVCVCVRVWTVQWHFLFVTNIPHAVWPQCCCCSYRC